MIGWLALYAGVVVLATLALTRIRPSWNALRLILAVASPVPIVVLLLGLGNTVNLLLDPVAELRLGPIGWIHVLQIYLVAAAVLGLVGLLVVLAVRKLVRSAKR